MAQTHWLYQWPLAGHITVTCEFGARDPAHNDKKHPHGHGGIDLAAIPGTPVLAARDGIVLYSGTADGYGHWVVLRHADEQRSTYGHLSTHDLAPVGKPVKASDLIGRVGTKAENGHRDPHLHFQINRPHTEEGSAGAMNPRRLLPPPA
jgi:murein DD-endopeptidase MepM/ murein hydrolase activator NlpD